MFKLRKEHLIFSVAVCVLSLVRPEILMAQTYGIKGGLTGGNIFGQPASNMRPGLQIGGFVKLGGDEMLYVKTELLLTHKGTLAWNVNRPVNVGLYYAELPIMLGFEVFERFSVNVGFQPALLLYGHADFSGIEGGADEGGITSSLTTMDYSTLLGFEYAISGNQLIGIRGNYGFVPLQGRNGELPFSGQNPRNYTFQIYFGYRFD